MFDKKSLRNWDLHMSTYEFIYNSTICTTRNKSLFEIVYGQNPRRPIDITKL